MADWIKLAALSLLISGLTAIFATAAFAIWWWLLRYLHRSQVGQILKVMDP